MTRSLTLEPPAVEPHGAAPPDDMLDPGPHPEGPLREPLRIIRERLESLYLDADAAALKHVRTHRRITRWAAVCGAAAIIIAVLQIGGRAAAGPGDAFWPIAEGLFVVVAAWVVFRGTRAAHHPRWLLERHKAERCRLTKYRALIDDRPWRGDPALLAAWSRDLQSEAERLRILSFHELEAWAASDHVRPPPDYDNLPPSAVDAVDKLVAYYRDRRLARQLHHFAGRVEADEAADRATRAWPARLFFASIVCALLHLAIHAIHGLVDGDSPFWHAVERANAALLFFAVVLPVVGAAVRTWRGAWEFARNTARFRAKSFGLKHLADHLRDGRPPEHLRRMYDCELLLESEHREWLRLMLEAEWYA